MDNHNSRKRVDFVAKRDRRERENGFEKQEEIFFFLYRSPMNARDDTPLIVAPI